MYNLKNEIQFGFETFDTNGSLIDKITGPGDPGYLLTAPAAPYFVALFPVTNASYEAHSTSLDIFLVQRFKIDENRKEILNTRTEFTMDSFDSIEEAFNMAEKLNCDYFYWSEWDCERIMVIIDAKGSRDPFTDKVCEYYTNEY